MSTSGLTSAPARNHSGSLLRARHTRIAVIPPANACYPSGQSIHHRPVGTSCQTLSRQSPWATAAAGVVLTIGVFSYPINQRQLHIINRDGHAAIVSPLEM